MSQSRFFKRSTLKHLSSDKISQSSSVIKTFLIQLKSDILHAYGAVLYATVISGDNRTYAYAADALLDSLKDVSPTMNLSRALDVYADVIKVFKRHSDATSWPGETENVHKAAVAQINRIGLVSNSDNLAEKDKQKIQIRDPYVHVNYTI